MKQKKRLTKGELVELKKAYRQKCKVKYYFILFAYLCDLAVKVYLCYKVGGFNIAIAGALIDFVAKWFMLKTMKMRR